jgi:hypothetical protein
VVPSMLSRHGNMDGPDLSLCYRRPALSLTYQARSVRVGFSPKGYSRFFANHHVISQPSTTYWILAFSS